MDLYEACDRRYCANIDDRDNGLVSRYEIHEKIMKTAANHVAYGLPSLINEDRTLKAIMFSVKTNALRS